MAYTPRSTAVTLGLAAVLGLHAQAPGVVTLRDLRDHARPLLIFAPQPDDPQLQLQLRTLQQHAAEAADHALLPIALPYHTPSPTKVQLSDDESEAARRRFHVAPSDFAVILVGKDGGAKLRSAKPLPMAKLNETIDAMPMRQDEMQSRPTH